MQIAKSDILIIGYLNINCYLIKKQPNVFLSDKEAQRFDMIGNITIKIAKHTKFLGIYTYTNLR